MLKVIQYLRDPHSNKIKKLKKEYQELDELSNIAVEIGDVAAYRSLQKEMRDVYFDYLTAIVVDALYNIVPHVLIIWLISIKFKTVTIPIIKYETSVFAAYMVGYLSFMLGRWMFNYIKPKLCAKTDIVGLAGLQKIK
ncbi:hypothetical protein N752_03650 [Desulforamulus aquiferis]|nr:hypothetical protein N752_03650 [Desulforamulus aquiferis]